MIRARVRTSDGNEDIVDIDVERIGNAIAKYHTEGKLEALTVSSSGRPIPKVYFHPNLVSIELFQA